MATISPYLNFNGKCEEAFNFYKSVFGGEFTAFQRFKEVPSEGHLPASEGDWIMHVALPIGDCTTLMGSDSPSTMGKIATGNNFHISVGIDGEEQADRVFNALSEGGRVSMPLHKAFWGARFGMLVDKFDIQWMVSQENGGNVSDTSRINGKIST